MKVAPSIEVALGKEWHTPGKEIGFNIWVSVEAVLYGEENKHKTISSFMVGSEDDLASAIKKAKRIASSTNSCQQAKQ